MSLPLPRHAKTEPGRCLSYSATRAHVATARSAVDEAAIQTAVGIDAAIAQERPATTDRLDACWIDGGRQSLLLTLRRHTHDVSVSIDRRVGDLAVSVLK